MWGKWRPKMQNERNTILQLLRHLGMDLNLVYDMNRAIDLIISKARLRKDEEVLEILHFEGYIY
jgi:hypothetical protein